MKKKILKWLNEKAVSRYTLIWLFIHGLIVVNGFYWLAVVWVMVYLWYDIFFGNTSKKFID